MYNRYVWKLQHMATFEEYAYNGSLMNAILATYYQVSDASIDGKSNCMMTFTFLLSSTQAFNLRFHLLHKTLNTQWQPYINVLVQERRNSIANALDLRLFCINPSIWSINNISLRWCCHLCPKYLPKARCMWSVYQKLAQMSYQS